MSRLLVLGGGWIGSAVQRSATASDVPFDAVDPPFDPILSARDDAAVADLRLRVRELRVTAVINACGRVRGSDAELEDANLEFVRWLCASLEGTGVRLVHVGSASEYGDPGSADPVDEQTECRPVGTYATTKAAGTDVVRAARERGLDATVARVFNVVGHPVPQVSPVHQWLTELRALPPEGGTVDVWWPPTTRDFVRIDDVADVLVELAAAPTLPAVVNVCSGIGLRFGEIVEALADALGVAVAVRSGERPGIESVIGDPSLLAATIGRVPDMSTSLLADCVVRGRSARPGR